jgi:hypothetical protein
MLMIVMSLAISLVSTNSLDSLSQLGNISSQTAQGSRIQQEERDKPYPSELNLPTVTFPKPTPIRLPPGDSAWVVQIVSVGGFTGSGRGNLMITSEGLLTWDGADGSCSRRLADQTMSALTEVVLAAGGSATSLEVSPLFMCSHRYVTSIIVQRKGVEGIVRASWDDVNQSKIPADVIRIYDSLMAQRGCKP